MCKERRQKVSRDYPDNGYPSVTEILSVLRKIGLEFWFKYNTLEFCNAESTKGKQVGSEIHDAIEQYINTGEAKIESEYAEEVNTALQSFMLFRKDYPDIDLKLSEVSLTSVDHCFNGTIDAPCPPILIDWKSGTTKKNKKPAIYNEAKTQASAYVKLWNEHNPNNLINKVMIVAIAKDKVAYNCYEMEGEEIEIEFNEMFLPSLKIWRHTNKKKIEKWRLKNDTV